MREHGFYCPSVGYWQANDDVRDELRATYPEGTVEVPLKPGADYEFEGASWVKKPVTLEDLRTAKIAAVVTKADALLSVGAPAAGGLHIALNDGSRADLTAMAATATAASAGAVSWPDSYSRGWITVENLRIPLATPAAGLTLAASVGNYYAAIIQHRRDLKDAALAAEDAMALEAIDTSVGWPTS